MTTQEIKQSVKDGLAVYWCNSGYQVVQDSDGQFLIKSITGHCIKLTWGKDERLNGQPEEFYI